MRCIKFRAWDKKYKIMFSDSGIRIIQNIYSNEIHKGTKGFIFMQYIGLHDRKGVEIYEGDILKCERFNQRPTVKWIESKARYNISGAKFYTVIGNIYENPKLIKDKK